ncbi:MAG: hypothetical protein L3J37_09560 [Rhodobacteraceae bacterium]|nr:hypothetical protein [Paracoccaceae bacterium]
MKIAFNRATYLFILPILAALGPYFEVVNISGVNLYAFRVAVLLGLAVVLLNPGSRKTIHREAGLFLVLFGIWLIWALEE